GRISGMEFVPDRFQVTLCSRAPAIESLDSGVQVHELSQLRRSTLQRCLDVSYDSAHTLQRHPLRLQRSGRSGRVECGFAALPYSRQLLSQLLHSTTKSEEVVRELPHVGRDALGCCGAVRIHRVYAELVRG